MRDVSTSLKEAVFAEYGISYSQHSNYEVDHFVPLELGGDNSIKNLWPEYDGGVIPNPKDKVEDYLHTEVCNGIMPLTQAQDMIRTDWYTVLTSMGQTTTSTSTKTATANTSTVSNTGGTSTGTSTTTSTSTVGGATGLCNDGTETTAIHHQGACSHHQGVARW